MDSPRRRVAATPRLPRGYSAEDATPRPRRGRTKETGLRYGPDGKETTDAAAALEGGAIATFGGHKGAGLALCVELLAGALSGGALPGGAVSKKEAKSWGHTFVCIKPEALVDDFETRASAVCDAVRAAGARVPGENSAKTADARVAADALPIPATIWESIQKTAAEGLP